MTNGFEPEPALPLKADCFAELKQFNTGYQSYNIRKEESNSYTIKNFLKEQNVYRYNKNVSVRMF